MRPGLLSVRSSALCPVIQVHGGANRSWPQVKKKLGDHSTSRIPLSAQVQLSFEERFTAKLEKLTRECLLQGTGFNGANSCYCQISAMWPNHSARHEFMHRLNGLTPVQMVNTSLKG